MTPVTVNGCFGWLHTNAEVGAGDVAVLLCPGVNRDALNAHHPLRLLADELLALGYPVMRFDYPGTGDSCDVEGLGGAPGEAWTAWQQSLHLAADWLRHASGARRLVFCGLRVGATLATLVAARRDDVAGLVLLAPVLRGHSYIRQLTVEAWLQSSTGAATGGGLEFQELSLSAETVDMIGRADLRQVALSSGQQVAVFSSSASRLLAECVQAWSRSGAAVACAGFEGLEPLLRDNMYESPSVDFSRVTGWLRHAVPASPRPPAAGAPDPEPAVLRPPGCLETPLRFGPDRRLFGMLCRPDRDAGNQAVIIGNFGRNPHYGLARFGVEFARKLATEGISSLRIDFAGLGDSLGPPGREAVLSHMFETDRRPDISAAIDALEELGFRRFAVQGLCAGAYHALHAALVDPRIATLLLVNLPTFRWQHGWSVRAAYGTMLKPIYYLRQLCKKEKLWRLLQGEVDIVNILFGQCLRLRGHVLAALRRLAALPRDGAAPSFAWHAMTTLSQRRGRTLFLFAPGDFGLDHFEEEFGPMGAKLRSLDGVSMQIVPGLDHHLKDRTTRQTAVTWMIDHLQTAVAVPDSGNASGLCPAAVPP